MRRRSHPLDPAAAAGLAALDAALEGRREDPAVDLIAAEVRGWAPPMTPAFAAALDGAVARGFAPAGSAPRPRPRRTRWMPAAGLAGAAAVAIVVAVSTSGGGGTSVETSKPSIGVATAPRAARDGGGTTVGGATAKGAPAPQAQAELAAPAVTTRRVERAAELTLSTPSNKLQDTADGVVGVVDRMGGYVERSDVAQQSGGGQATFDLRVPTSRLDAALAALSRLGHVQSRTQHAQDITAPYQSAVGRLHDARAERVALLRALARATTVQQTESLRARLRIVRSEIAAARGDLASVRRRADLAHVSVTVVGRHAAGGAGAPSGGHWTPGDALHDAVRVLGVVAGVAIVALAIALPLALLAALAVLSGRSLRRRRREGALDAVV
jgi:hypothetical protein